MNVEQFARRNDGMVREYDYGDRTVVAADLGPGAASVDVADGTAIVVFEDGRQVDLDLPAGDEVQAFITNGILSIEVTNA